MEGGFEELGRIDEGIAVHDTHADELSIFQPRNQAEHPFLLPPAQVGLEPHQIPQLSGFIFLAQLHHSVGAFSGAIVAQSHGFEGTVTHGIFPPLTHFLDGQTTFKKLGGFPLEILKFCLFGGTQLLPKSQVLLLIHRAVDVVGIAFVVARGAKCDFHIDRVANDDGTGRIEKAQILQSREALQIHRQIVAGEGSGGEDDNAFGGNLFDFLAREGNQGMIGEGFGEIATENRAIDG